MRTCARIALLANILVAVCLAPAQVASAPIDAAEREYQSANGLLHRGLHELAIEEYRRFLHAHPEHDKAPLARYGLAVCLFRTGAYESARPWLDELLALDAFDFRVEAQTMLGQTLLALNEPARAADVFGAVLEAHPDHELADDAHAGLVEALQRAGREEEALQRGREFVSRWPRSPLRARVDYFQALAEMAGRQYSQAAKRLDNLLNEASGDIVPHATLALAQSRAQLGDHAASEKAYRRCIELAPQSATPARIGLASTLRVMERLPEARELLEQTLRDGAGSQTSLAQLELGRVLLDSERPDEAFAAFEESLRDEATIDHALFWMARCRLRQDRFADAARLLEDARRRRPDSLLGPEIALDQAVALARSGSLAEARECLAPFRASLRDHPLTPDALRLLAHVEQLDRRYDESAALCRTFLETWPAHRLTPDVSLLAAENEFLAGRYEEALKRFSAFEQAYADDDRSREVGERIGLTLHRLGRYAEAEARLRHVDARNGGDALLALADALFQQGQWEQAERKLTECLAASAPPRADDLLLKLGLSRARQEKHAEALAAFEKLLTNHADSPHASQALFEIGQTLLALEQWPAARDALEHLLTRDDGHRFHVYARNHLATLAQRGGDEDAAIAQLTRVIETPQLEPRVVGDALLRRGRMLLNLSRHVDAERDFSRVVESFADTPSSPQARALLALAIARQSRHDDTLEAIRRIDARDFAALAPELRELLQYEKAAALDALKRPEAIAAYRESLEARSPDVRALSAIGLAELELAAARPQAALELLRGAATVARGIESPTGRDLRKTTLYRLGVVAFEAGAFDEAAAALDGLLETIPDSELTASASAFAGEAHFRAGRHDKAVQRLSRVAEEFPDDPAAASALLRMGEALLELQRWAVAEQAFADYLARYAEGPERLQAQFGLGWARENLGRFDEAIAAYRPAAEGHKGPTAARAQFQIGECLYAKKQYEEAVRELLKVDILYAHPEWSAAALFEAGRCFEQLGKTVEARRQFQQVTQRHSDTRWGELAAKRLTALPPATPGRNP